MALTEIQLRNLISFNVPDNTQGLVTPFKIREVMNEMVTKAFDSQLDSLVADNPLSFNPTTKTLSMPRATAGQSGYLHALDFAVFNTVAGDYVSQQWAYYNPSWLMELSWNKIINTPTSLSGYGITDPVVLTSDNYTDPSWIASLAYSKLTGAPVLGTVAAINTNGNGNTYLAGDGTWKTIDLSGYVTLSGTQTISGAKTFSSLINATGGIGTSGATDFNFYANNALVGRIFQGTGRWSIGYSSPADGGYMLDVNGVMRANGLIFNGSASGVTIGTTNVTNSKLIISGENSNNSVLEYRANLYQDFYIVLNQLNGQYRFNIGTPKLTIARDETVFGAALDNTIRLRGQHGGPNANGLDFYLTSGGADGTNAQINRRGGDFILGLGDGYGNVIPKFVFRTKLATVTPNLHTDLDLLTLQGDSATLAGGLLINGSSLNGSAALQVDSTTKGVLLSRMTTTQRTDIVSPAAGLIVYDTSLNHLCFFNGTAWQRISHSPA